MQEIFEKIKERLERERDIHRRAYDVAIQTHERAGYASYARACDEAIEIVNQVAEEYKDNSHITETVRTDRLECEVPSDYFVDIREVHVIDEWTEEKKVFRETGNDGWIPVSERLPECKDYSETDALLFQLGSGTIEVGYFGKRNAWRDRYFRHYRSISGFDVKDVIA